MNRYQRILLAVALANGLLVLFFPPFNNTPLAKGALATFDGFLPFFAGQGPVNRELLSLELMFLGANTLTAWLLLQAAGIRPPKYVLGIAVLTISNLMVILLFPPFEPYSSISKTIPGTFDSFYFIMGSRSQRAIFFPMLYMECAFVVVNALVLALLFKGLDRSTPTAPRQPSEERHHEEDRHFSAYKHHAAAHPDGQPLFPHDDQRMP